MILNFRTDTQWTDEASQILIGQCAMEELPAPQILIGDHSVSLEFADSLDDSVIMQIKALVKNLGGDGVDA